MTALDEPGPSTATDGVADDERRATQERMVERYAEDGRHAELVRSAVSEAFTRLSDARVTAFVPVLVERAVRRSLPA